jgi:hypothetical protein
MGLLSRIFLLVSLLIVVLVGLATMSLYFHMTRSLTRTALDSMEARAINATLRLDEILERMDDVALHAMTDPTIIENFAALESKQGNDNAFKSDILREKSVADMLATINGPRSVAARIATFDTKGDYVAYGIIPDSPRVG